VKKNWQKGLLIVIAVLLVVSLSSNGFAWVISKELKQELLEKKAAAAKNPKDPSTLFDLAITYGYTNHLLEGIDTLKKINVIDPQFRFQALGIYIKKVIEDPGDWKLRFRLAFVYYFNDKKTDSVREFENVLKIDPYNVWAYGYMALLYGEMGEIDKAISITKQALKIDSNVAALHLLLGEGYLRKGDFWGGWAERMEAIRLRALGY
jgi:tetratricopeptide (TPR) repeat protein